MAKTDVAVFNPGQVPAFAKSNELSPMAKALAGSGGGSGKRLSIKGGVFRLIVDGKEIGSIEDRHLNVVLVNAAPKIGRTYYAGTYEEGTVSAPDCWSADGDKPDATAKNKQAATCAACPQNVKGSGQGDSRACRFSQRVAVVLENDMSGNVLQLSLPAASIFGKADGDKRPLQAYARWLAEQGIDPATLVTQLKFDTTAATPKLFFKAARWLEKEEFAICQEQGKSEDAVKAITFTVAQMDSAKEPHVVRQMSSDDKPKEEPEAELPQPTVKKTAKPQANGAAKGNLAQIVTDWDQDD